MKSNVPAYSGLDLKCEFPAHLTITSSLGGDTFFNGFWPIDAGGKTSQKYHPPS